VSVSSEFNGMLILEWDSDGRLHVDRAHPCVVLDEESVLAAFRGDDPGVSLELGGTGGIGTIQGSVLRIAGVNRQVVYRVTGEPVPEALGISRRSWVCRWPD